MIKQKGMALLVSLIILVVALMLGLSSFQSSLFEERMASNYRLSVSALQSAEAGVDKMLDSVMAFSFSTADENTLCDGVDPAVEYSDLMTGNPHSFSSDGSLDRYYSIKLGCSAEDELVGYSRGWVEDNDSIKLSARTIKFTAFPPGFATIKGMIADNDIEIKGNSSVVGVVHANGDVYIKIPDGDEAGEPEGSVTASGTVTLDNNEVTESGANCETLICASSDVGKVKVQTAEEKINEIISSYETGATFATAQSWSDQEAGYTEISESYSEHFEILPYDSDKNICNVDGVDLNDDDSMSNEEGPDGYPQKIYYCPGDLEVSGDFSGAALMANGSITHNGSSDLGTYQEEGVVDTFLYATGGITLNGQNDTYGEYLSDGDFRQDGTSTIYGTVVSGGSIRANGGIDFVAMDTGKIKYITSGSLDTWNELEEPGDVEKVDMSDLVI